MAQHPTQFQKIEDSIGMRKAAEIILKDLRAKFPRKVYSPKDDLATIMQKEGQESVLQYIHRKYLGS